MTRTYTLKNGSKIRAFYSSNRTLTVYDSNMNEDVMLNIMLDSKNDRKTVCYHGETIDVDDFDYVPLDELIEIINNKEVVSNDLVLATFMKEKDRVGLVASVETLGRRYSLFGRPKVQLEDTDKVVIVPVEKEYTIDKWFYKMEFEALDPDVRSCVSGLSTYTSDIISMIISGIFKLVNIENYK